MMVSLHMLAAPSSDGRHGERSQHVLDIVETFSRMSGEGRREPPEEKGRGVDDMDEEEGNDGEDGL